MKRLIDTVVANLAGLIVAGCVLAIPIVLYFSMPTLERWFVRLRSRQDTE